MRPSHQKNRLMIHYLRYLPLLNGESGKILSIFKILQWGKTNKASIKWSLFCICWTCTFELVLKRHRSLRRSELIAFAVFFPLTEACLLSRDREGRGSIRCHNPNIHYTKDKRRNINSCCSQRDHITIHEYQLLIFIIQDYTGLLLMKHLGSEMNHFICIDAPALWGYFIRRHTVCICSISH